MKKNHRTYLLLLLVLVVWGILGFRIVKTVSPSTKGTVPLVHAEKFVPTPIKKRDSFALNANYRDPFLGTFPKTEKPKKVRVTVAQKEILPDKNISYTGFITENGSRKKIFFLTVDGMQQIFSENDVLQGVELLSGDGKKVQVHYNGKTKKIPLSQ